MVLSPTLRQHKKPNNECNPTILSSRAPYHSYPGAIPRAQCLSVLSATKNEAVHNSRVEVHAPTCDASAAVRVIHQVYRYINSITVNWYLPPPCPRARPFDVQFSRSRALFTPTHCFTHTPPPSPPPFPHPYPPPTLLYDLAFFFFV